jgi:hypothetical protein
MANGLVQFGALVGVTYILKYRFKDKRERERGGAFRQSTPFGPERIRIHVKLLCLWPLIKCPYHMSS